VILPETLFNLALKIKLCFIEKIDLNILYTTIYI